MANDKKRKNGLDEQNSFVLTPDEINFHFKKLIELDMKVARVGKTILTDNFGMKYEIDIILQLTPLPDESFSNS